MTRIFRARALAGSALPLLMAMTAGVQAQAQSHAGSFETVMVEARKRVEDQQVVPISITAYSQADLDRLNIRTAWTFDAPVSPRAVSTRAWIPSTR